KAQGLVHVLGVDQDEPAEMLLGLDEGPIGRRRVAGSRSHAHGRFGIGEGSRHDVVAVALELLVVLERAAVEGLHVLLGESVDLLFVDIYQAKVLHLNSPLSPNGGYAPSRSETPGIDSGEVPRDFSGRSVDSHSRAPTIGRDEAATADSGQRQE